MSTIDPQRLAQDVIDRFPKTFGMATGFEYLIEARSGLEAFSHASIKFSSSTYNENTENLVLRLIEVFTSVYGQVPVVRVYLPFKPISGPLSDQPNP